MKTFFKIVLSDYLQYIRSYAFLITLAIALYVTYTFVPDSTANYRTLSIGSYVGLPNSAWTGYVSAMMTSVFLSISGFFLINSNIKKDVDTGVGMIIATTSISNFRYLLTKAWSNFFILLTIMGIVLLMSVSVYLFRSGLSTFEPTHFILPYLMVALPAIFFISSLAVVAEVFLHRYTVLLNFTFFIFLLLTLPKQAGTQPVIDLYGIQEVTAVMQQNVRDSHAGVSTAVSMGFVFSQKHLSNSFLFEGVSWSAVFILSRLVWMASGIILVFISSLFFHRFDIGPDNKKQKKGKIPAIVPADSIPKNISRAEFPVLTTNYQILPLIQTEVLMLIRKGPKWLWVVNLGGMIALLFVPIAIAVHFVLPSLWFFQVTRWSDLATKEKTNRVHYFSYASYKPLTRLFLAQILAGIILSVILSLPLLIRLIILMQFIPAGSILTGAVFIVFVAVVMGLMTGTKKLFEILFFICLYGNVNQVLFVDYYGGQHQGLHYLIVMIITTVCLAVISFLWRKLEMLKL